MPLSSLAESACIGDDLAGRSVLIHSARQAPAVQALLELDGQARRMVLAPPDANPDHLDAVIQAASIDTLVTDDLVPRRNLDVLGPTVRSTRATPLQPRFDTEWVLFTSGTTGAPKLVPHMLDWADRADHRDRRDLEHDV